MDRVVETVSLISWLNRWRIDWPASRVGEAGPCVLNRLKPQSSTGYDLKFETALQILTGNLNFIDQTVQWI